MAKELRQVEKKEIGLKCCPFCGSKMYVGLEEVDECVIAGHLIRPKSYRYVISCPEESCLINSYYGNFSVSDASLDRFLERFNNRVHDSEIYSIPVDDSCVE